MEKWVLETTEGDVKDDTRLPEFLYGLFWDHDPDAIHMVRHAYFVMGRIMERGTWKTMRWMLKTHSKDQLTDDGPLILTGFYGSWVTRRICFFC